MNKTCQLTLYTFTNMLDKCILVIQDPIVNINYQHAIWFIANDLQKRKQNPKVQKMHNENMLLYVTHVVQQAAYN